MTADTGGNPELTVADTALGQVLVADGMTLYAFTPDTGGVSTCYDDCASAWPPVTGDAAAEAGLDASLVGTITREDGSLQATYNGWPLYEFARDTGTEPTGQNVESHGGEWYLISPEGEEVHTQ
jgi:predicted lipoprotein with Yx(FWY)xxD motif